VVPAPFHQLAALAVVGVVVVGVARQLDPTTAGPVVPGPA